MFNPTSIPNTALALGYASLADGTGSKPGSIANSPTNKPTTTGSIANSPTNKLTTTGSIANSPTNKPADMLGALLSQGINNPDSWINKPMFDPNAVTLSPSPLKDFLPQVPKSDNIKQDGAAATTSTSVVTKPNPNALNPPPVSTPNANSLSTSTTTSGPNKLEDPQSSLDKSSSSGTNLNPSSGTSQVTTQIPGPSISTAPSFITSKVIPAGEVETHTFTVRHTKKIVETSGEKSDASSDHSTKLTVPKVPNLNDFNVVVKVKNDNGGKKKVNDFIMRVVSNGTTQQKQPLMLFYGSNVPGTMVKLASPMGFKVAPARLDPNYDAKYYGNCNGRVSAIKITGPSSVLKCTIVFDDKPIGTNIGIGQPIVKTQVRKE